MSQERSGQYTRKGAPLTLVGPELKAGDPAPAYAAFKGLGQVFESSEIDGKLRFYNVIPSVDTGICDAQTKRFSEEASKFKDVEWITISCDAPTALSRWCSAGSITNLRMLSDFRDHAFGLAYGLYVKELGLLQRAVLIVGTDNCIKYFQRVPEMAQGPNYDEALAELKKAQG